MVGVTDIDLFSGICGKCRQSEKESIKKQNSQYANHLRSHPLKDHEHLAIPATTTATYPEYDITEVRGVICGETVMGANFLKDFLSGFTVNFFHLVTNYYLASNLTPAPKVTTVRT